MNPSSFSLRKLFATLLTLALLVGSTGLLRADAQTDAEAGALAMSRDFEKEGFVFRADAWKGELPKSLGKAIRIQLFKGNDYRFCIAVPPKSGVHISGAVLNFQGQPVGEIQPLLAGWGIVLSYKPTKTGVYVITLRQKEEGKPKDTGSAMFIGYK